MTVFCFALRFSPFFFLAGVYVNIHTRPLPPPFFENKTIKLLLLFFDCE